MRIVLGQKNTNNHHHQADHGEEQRAKIDWHHCLQLGAHILIAQLGAFRAADADDAIDQTQESKQRERGA